MSEGSIIFLRILIKMDMLVFLASKLLSDILNPQAMIQSYNTCSHTLAFYDLDNVLNINAICKYLHPSILCPNIAWYSILYSVYRISIIIDSLKYATLYVFTTQFIQIFSYRNGCIENETEMQTIVKCIIIYGK